MNREFQGKWVDTPEPCYRLDLRLGIPRSRGGEELEWLIGDQGLCRHPDQHPSLILADILSEPHDDPTPIKSAVKKCSLDSGPIKVKLSSTTEKAGDLAALSYTVRPNRGLCEFIRALSDTFVLGAPEGSLVSCMGKTTPWVPQSTVTAHEPWQALVRVKRRPEGYMRNRMDKSTLLQPSKMRHDFPCGERHSRDREGCRVFSDTTQRKPLVFDILRIILRKGRTPVAEYDLYLRSWLAYPESTRGIYERRALREFRIQKGYQMTRPDWSETPRIYVISDLHLGHENAVPRYKRPFPMGKISEMDRVLIRNWNWTVRKNDVVLFLGDLSFRSQESSESYLQRLEGRIFYLEGNHDLYYSYMSHCLFMNYRGARYLFIHDPEELVRPFDGWVIHGHVHNKDLTDFPFFNPFEKRVNVSAEMVGYRPIPLEEIHRLVQESTDVLDFYPGRAKGAEEGEKGGIAAPGTGGMLPLVHD